MKDGLRIGALGNMARPSILLAWANHCFVGLPITIGVTMAALLSSLALVRMDVASIDYGLRRYEESLLRSIDFSDVLMQGMLLLLLGMPLTGTTPIAAQGLRLLLQSRERPWGASFEGR